MHAINVRSYTTPEECPLPYNCCIKTVVQARDMHSCCLVNHVSNDAEWHVIIFFMTVCCALKPRFRLLYVHNARDWCPSAGADRVNTALVVTQFCSHSTVGSDVVYITRARHVYTCREFRGLLTEYNLLGWHFASHAHGDQTTTVWHLALLVKREEAQQIKLRCAHDLNESGVQLSKTCELRKRVAFGAPQDNVYPLRVLLGSKLSVTVCANSRQQKGKEKCTA